jgi:hypothetical protein
LFLIVKIRTQVIGGEPDDLIFKILIIKDNTMQLSKKAIKVTNTFDGFSRRLAYFGTPYKQTPPEERKKNEVPDSNQRIQADDLFSIFTADIIKENVVFTR